MSPTLRLHQSHPWDLSPEEARRVQSKLRDLVLVQSLPVKDVHQVGGLDASFHQGKIIAAVVVIDLASLKPIDQSVVEMSIPFPYIPGLLSFREAPALLSGIEKLSHFPQVFIVDGHGLAHPRRFGIACHLGVLLDLPCIGLAKSILIGKAESPDDQVGSTTELCDGDEVIGMAIRTRPGSKPVYVSIGHRVDLPTAVHLVMQCSRGYRLPEPARLAHQLAASAKKGIPR